MTASGSPPRVTARTAASCARRVRAWRVRASGAGAVVAGLVLVTALSAVTGCSAPAASPSPTAVPTSVIASPAISSPTAGGTPVATSGPSASAGTTSTDWGEIRDAVPAGFPLPPGAEPADLPDGPFSGTYTTSTPAAGAADAVRAGLIAAGYTNVGSSGTETGEIAIDATGAVAGCRVRVTVRPLGALTAVEVLYGAACP